ncbi:hypothetical protein BRC97_11200 [Halobacteriales archaeon QS_6_71_20]|nr:MAG: hypothetical protein BRC97_11200 [Halobacteriales archaeon QS_6_71_20]
MFEFIIETERGQVGTGTLIEFLLPSVILFNAVLSSVTIRTDGGDKANASLHFVLMTWLGSGVAVFAKHLVTTVLSI